MHLYNSHVIYRRVDGLEPMASEAQMLPASSSSSRTNALLTLWWSKRPLFMITYSVHKTHFGTVMRAALIKGNAINMKGIIPLSHFLTAIRRGSIPLPRRSARICCWANVRQKQPQCSSPHVQSSCLNVWPCACGFDMCACVCVCVPLSQSSQLQKDLAWAWIGKTKTKLTD